MSDCEWTELWRDQKWHRRGKVGIHLLKLSGKGQSERWGSPYFKWDQSTCLTCALSFLFSVERSMKRRQKMDHVLQFFSRSIIWCGAPRCWCSWWEQGSTLTLPWVCFRYAIFQSFSLDLYRRWGHGDISSFGALATALAATVGTGNIVGVATAIQTGGPGALFWMWMAAFFGMATKYAEGLLAIRYRTKDDNGHISGGPMYYILHGMGEKWRPLAIFFAVAGCW